MSLLDEVNRRRWLEQQQQQSRAGTVQFYAPNLRPPTPTPPPPAVGQLPNNGSVLSQLTANLGERKAPEQDGGSGFGRGLGFVINNPITQGILKPLEVLDIPRRGVWSTIQEGTDFLQGEGFSGGDWLDQVKDPTFGAGDVIPDTGNKWFDRAVGLTGDILGDPLTWVTAGVGSIPGKTGRVRAGGRLLRAQERAADAVAAARMVGDPQQIRLAQEAADALGSAADVQRIIKRGPGVASRNQLEVMGLDAPGLKFGTRKHNVRIPGTETLARGVNEGFATTRTNFNRLPGLEGVRRARHPAGLEDAFEKLITGKGSIGVKMAIETIEGSNYYRVGAKKFGEAQARRVNAVKEELKEPGIIAATETPGVNTVVNDILRAVRVDAEELGLIIPELGGSHGDTFFPRRLNRGFFDFLDGNAEARAAWLQASGMTTDDLLEEGGHLQRRVWVPNEDGTPKVVKIGKPGSVGNGREIVIRTGTLDEIEGQLRGVFPEYTGKFYEHDPQIVLESYISSLERDVGAHYMAREMAAEGSHSFGRSNYDSANGHNTRGEEVQVGMADPYSEAVVDKKATKLANEAAVDPLRQVVDSATTRAGVLEGQAEQAVTGARRGQLDNLDTIIADWGDPARRGPRRRQLEAEGGYVRPDGTRVKGSLENKLSATGKKVSEQIARHEQQLRSLQMEMAEAGRAAGATKGRGRMAVLNRYKQLSKKLFALIEERKAITEQIRQLSPGSEDTALLIDQLRRTADRAYEELLGKTTAAVKGVGKYGKSSPTDWPTLPSKRFDFTFADLRRQLDELDDIHLQNLAADRELYKTLTPAEKRRWTIAGKTIKASQWGPIPQELKQIDIRLGQLRSENIAAASNLRVTEEAAKKATAAAKASKAQAKGVRQKLKSVQDRLAAPLKGKTRYRQFYEMAKDDFDEATVLRMEEHLNDIELFPDRAVNGRKRMNFLIAEWRKARQVEVAKLEEALAGTTAETATKATKAFKAAQAEVARLKRIGGELETRRAALQKPIDAARRVRDPLEGRRLASAQTHAREVHQIKTEMDQIMAGIELQPGSGLTGSAMDDIRNMRQTADILEADGPPLSMEYLRGEKPEARSQRHQNPDLQATIALSNRGDLVEAGIGDLSRDVERVMGGTDPVVNKIRSDTSQEVHRLRNEQVNTKLKVLGANEEHARVMADLDAQTTGVLADLEANAVERATLANGAIRARALRAKLGAHNPAKPNELRKAVDDFLEVLPYLDLTDDADRATATLLNNAIRNLDTADGLRMEAGMVARELKAAERGDLHQVFVAQLRDGWTALHKGSVRKGDLLIEAELARRFQNVYAITGDPKLFGRTLTAYTNFFKTYATMTPGFHIRNAMSNIFNNAADGVSLPTQLRALRMWREYSQAADPSLWLKNLNDPEIKAAFDAAFGSGAGGRFFESGVAAGPALGTAKEKIFRNKFTKLGQEWGQDWVEGPARLAMALDTIVGKSSAKTITGAGGERMITRQAVSLNELTMTALDRITRIHFDYGQISRFDESARRLIPFWTFMSRNLPMQISQMWMKPRLFNQYNSFVRNFRGEDEDFTPEYFKNIGAFRLGETKLGGLPLYLQPDFAHNRVIEDVSNIEDVISGRNPARALSDINPFFTAPAELITSKNFFTGRDYQDDDLVKVEGINKAMIPFLAIMGQLERSPDGSYIATEKGIDFMRSINPVLDRITRLAPQTTGGSDALSRQLESIARTSGIPIRVLSPEQQRSTQRSQYFDRQDELRHRQAVLQAQNG